MAGKCTAEAVSEAVALIENGATNKDVCDYLGINESTFYRWLQDPKTDNQRKLCEGMKKAEAKRKLWHIGNINAAAKKDWKASAWYLERRYPQEFARAERPRPRGEDAVSVDEFLKEWRDEG